MSSYWKSHCINISQKWVFAILATTGVCIGNIVRIILSITIVDMTIPISEVVNQGDNTCGDFNNALLRNDTSITHIDNSTIPEERYGWDEYTQGVILGAFFWGYSFTQPLYGALAERFGGKYFLGLSIFIPSMITFFTPLLVSWGGSSVLSYSRVLMGVANGAMYPVASTMISQWTTLKERTTIANAIYSGSSLGFFFGIIIPGLIMKYSGMGWPAVFYAFGAIGILWFPAWVLLVYNSPSQHPFISKEELEYLKSDSSGNKTTKKLPPAPWKHILISKEFWAFTISLIGNAWAFFAMVTDLPKYMSSVIKFSIDSNSYFSAVPYLLMTLVSMTIPLINDKIMEKQWMSITNIRKLFASLTLTGPAVFIILASFAECNKTMVVAMFMIGIAVMGCLNSSLMMCPLDMSPNYAGSLMAVGNSISSIVGIIVPYTIGILTPNQTIQEWRHVFWIVFFFSVLSNVIYLWWFDATVRDWDDPNFSRDKLGKAKYECEADTKMLPQELEYPKLYFVIS